MNTQENTQAFSQKNDQHEDDLPLNIVTDSSRFADPDAKTAYQAGQVVSDNHDAAFGN